MKRTSEQEWSELAAAAPRRPGHVLQLFVTGATARSARAIRNIRSICEKHLKGAYKLQVIDIYQQPELAARSQILAVPTLIRQLPLPMRTLVGDLSNTESVLVGLNIRPRES